MSPGTFIHIHMSICVTNINLRTCPCLPIYFVIVLVCHDDLALFWSVDHFDILIRPGRSIIILRDGNSWVSHFQTCIQHALKLFQQCVKGFRADFSLGSQGRFELWLNRSDDPLREAFSVFDLDAVFSR
jgi:hypothetical protein